MPPAVVCVVSWLVPGAGHLMLGRRQKGLVFLIALPLMFAIGLALEGRLFPFVFSEPLVGLAAVANLGMGVPYFLARAIGLGPGVVTAASQDGPVHLSEGCGGQGGGLEGLEGLGDPDAQLFLDDALAKPGLIAGPRLSKREEMDVEFGFRIAKEVSRLDIGQTVVVKGGTVLAVEAFEGTNAAITRGGELGRKDAVMIKVSKPKQDFRFDVPVVGPLTIEAAHRAKIRVIAVEADKTLLLEPERTRALVAEKNISLFGLNS